MICKFFLLEIEKKNVINGPTRLWSYYIIGWQLKLIRLEFSNSCHYGRAVEDVERQKKK